MWDDDSGDMCWEEEDAFQPGDSSHEAFLCNTRKDKDKRVCRHSFGVLFGCSPCGVGMSHVIVSIPIIYSYSIPVTIFNKLYHSENVKQVYGIVTDWLATLDENDRRRIK